MKLLWIALVFLSLFALVPSSTAVLSATTNDVASVSASGAILNGSAAGVVGSAIVWFEYTQSGSNYIYKTTNQTITADGYFYKTLSGIPVLSNTKYYFRAVAFDTSIKNGAQKNFTTSALSAIPDYNFDANFDNLTNSEIEPQNLSKVSSSAYTDVLGSVFWGIIYGLVFIVIWMRQKDVTIPSILGFIIGATLWSSMPADWTSMAMALTVVSLAGLMYTILKGRT